MMRGWQELKEKPTAEYLTNRIINKINKINCKKILISRNFRLRTLIIYLKFS